MVVVYISCRRHGHFDGQVVADRECLPRGERKSGRGEINVERMIRRKLCSARRMHMDACETSAWVDGGVRDGRRLQSVSEGRQLLN
jgi:hypothetical protein